MLKYLPAKLTNSNHIPTNYTQHSLCHRHYGKLESPFYWVNPKKVNSLLWSRLIWAYTKLERCSLCLMPLWWSGFVSFPPQIAHY